MTIGRQTVQIALKAAFYSILREYTENNIQITEDIIYNSVKRQARRQDFPKGNDEELDNQNYTHFN